ncbi:MAG: thiamine-phosphate pyrophosphorylase [Thermoleophilaceae bacterium]|nr:thiamine-phosphate pyrophosphorylase [Thermoleophilaceae bacterium]
MLGDARLYFVVETSASDRLLDAALAGGVDLLQLRDHEASGDELLAAAERFRDACDAHGALFVVNDRPELALQAGADGVHVGQDDLPVEDVRRLVGPELVIGLSTHSPEQFDAGLRADADYLSVGPVWETPTKAGRPATGIDYVRHAAANAPKPWFAIGGIDESNIGEVVAAGASRAVVVRAIRDAADPRASATALKSALAHVE